MFCLGFSVLVQNNINESKINKTKALVFFFMFGIPFPYLFAEEVIQKPWDDNGSIVHLWSSFLFDWSLILFVLKSENGKKFLKSFRMLASLKLVS